MKLIKWFKHLIWEQDFSENHIVIPAKKRSIKHPYAKKAEKKILEMGASYCCHSANHVKKMEVRRVLR